MDLPLKLVNEKDPILKQLCPLFDFSSDIDLDKLFYDMKIVLQHYGGIGLAAPQVGLPHRIFIFGDPIQLAINPEVVTEHGEVSSFREGCLSFPHLILNIKRYTTLGVRYQNIKGNLIEDRLDGLTGRCFNHEVDHVNGILFTDRAAKLSLKLALEKRTKLLKKGERNV